MRLALRVALLAGAFIGGTLALGWWGVVLVAIAWGMLGRAVRGAGIIAGASAMLAWAGLLAWAAAAGPVVSLAATLGGIMGAPGAAFIALALVFPAALAWAGARTAAGLAAIVTSRES